MAPGATDLATAPDFGASPAGRLLAWYRAHARVLPWRARPGEAVDPYPVWLSEIMLQQTTVVTVEPYFRDFLARWPRLEDLAAAPLDAVLAAWAGLGYYARARNLHACARALCADHGGRFPDRVEALRALPGIGPYTAAAIAAIAFGRRASVVDGNVERVIARLFAVETPLPGAKAELRRLAEGFLPEEPEDAFPYGDFAQAMMELGATVCLPKRPRCGLCPLAGDCRARAAGRAEALPRRAPKRARPTRRGVAFWLTRPDGAVLLRRRPESGLLGGMMEVPSTPWRGAAWNAEAARGHAPCAADWRALPGRVTHVFTHFRLELEVWAAAVDGADADGADGGGADGDGAESETAGRWILPGDLAAAALPTVMRKVARHAVEATAASEGSR
jgi:A/G-specific adenine glycosylase